MKDLYKHDNILSGKLRFHHSFLILILSLIFIVMIIPSVIVNTGAFARLQSNVPNQKQTTSKVEQQPFQKSPITIGWVSGNHFNLQHLEDYHNLNVVSPVLGSIDGQFHLQDLSNSGVINTIQTQGKRVWARIVMEPDTITNVHAFLTNQDKVQGLISQIHQTGVKNNWNGINLDIENVGSSDRGAFSQFIKNLSNELNKTSIIFSIDLPPDPGEKNNNQSPFDHNVIAKYCNYIVFMGYDQHWSTDPVPGPVTSLSWLKQNIQEFIQTGIPPGKFILGLPAYTRIWVENQQGNIVNNPAEPIEYVESLMIQNHRNLSWDSVLGEYFTSYYINNLQYKIWLPTEKSYNLYLQLINQYHLDGTALWNLNLMEANYWNQIYSRN